MADETPPGQSFSSNEAALPVEERAPLKRKSDENLGNDQKRRQRSEESSIVEQDRRVIIMKGSLPKLALPDGWIALNHRSGGIVYLHKPMRVCTWSRPYHIGGGSVRVVTCQEVIEKSMKLLYWTFKSGNKGEKFEKFLKTKHDVPLASIPCFHQKRGMALEEAEAKGGNEEKDSFLSKQGASILNALNMSEMNSDDGTPTEDADTEKAHSVEGKERNGLDVIMSLSNSGGMLTESNEVTGVEMVDVTQKDAVTKRSDLEKQHSQVVEDCSSSKQQEGLGSETSMKPGKLVEERNGPLLDLVDAKELGSYLSSLWEFQSLTQDQEKNAVIFQPQVSDDVELPVSLECQLYALKGPDNSKQSGKDLLLNPGGKTPVALLHEYCQRTFKTKPVYLSSECESAQTPFMAEVQIDGIKYGIGTGSNKKVAKQVAAEATLEVLMPGVFNKVRDYQISKAELEFFDKIDIGDPRIPEFCSKTTLPNPSQILEECLKRNQGVCPSSIKFTTVCGQDRSLSYKITCGKHEAMGPCKNKRLGKQLASQQILKKLHPHLEKWGALIRIYCDRPTGTIKKYKKDDGEYINEKELRRGSAQQNPNLLERLKEEMRKLCTEKKNGQTDARYNSSEPVFTVDI